MLKKFSAKEFYENIISTIDLLDSACKNVGLDDCSSSSDSIINNELNSKDQIGFISEVEQVSDDNFKSYIIRNFSNFDYSNYNFKNTVEKKIFFVTKSNKSNQKFNQLQDFCLKLNQNVYNEAIINDNDNNNGSWIKNINLNLYC